MFPFLRSASLLLLALVLPVLAEKPQVLQTPHYRILYAKKYEPIAGEVLKVAEGVWPTLAKAYDAYSNYQTIDIFLLDPGDYANGEAVYPYSRVEIFVPHLNWVMRGRANWIGNVAAHEIAHVFSLRQKARLWIFSDATIGGGTINKEWNWSFLLPWVPLPAPNWWIEGIAQFESEAAGYDTWDSQRDMIVRDAWLTHSLPTLGEIETFDGEWIQGERVYNTGFAFLRYLRDRYGIDKVRQLAVPKPLFHFGGAVVAVYGKTLTELYSEWQASLAEHYGSFEELGRDTLFDRDIQGSFTQNLAFSPDGRTIAWLGNGDRDYALNWIYWKDTGDVTTRSGEPVMGEQGKAPGLHRNAQASTWGETQGAPQFWNNGTNPVLKRLPTTLPRNFSERRTDPPGTGRSDEISSTGLEFNHDGTRLLTTRNDWYSTYNDIWEYELHAALKSESEKWHRLTWNIRASYASYHPTQSHTIVFSKFDEGSSNVAILDSAGRVHELTRFQEGQQVYNPRFTPKGDSIYFTLGIGDREAIASISAKAAAWDPFANLEDSAQFPDSLNLAKGQRVRFITPLSRAAYRDLRFSGDTLFYSSNGRDGVYNVFARRANDSMEYRVTRNRTQALEPLSRNGNLYYQGYRQQKFQIFQQPLELKPEGKVPAATDSVPLLHAKKKDYTKAADEGEPGVKKVAWSISPYLSLYPQFIEDEVSRLNLRAGLQVTLGSLSGALSQSFGGYVSKRMDFNTPMDYGVNYSGDWSGITTWHQRFGWTPNLNYGLSRDVAKRNFTDRYLFEDTYTYDTLLEEDNHRTTYTYDMIGAAMGLPLNGLRLGPGFLGTQWYGRYWNENVTDDLTSVTLTDLTTGDKVSASGSQRIFDVSINQHLYQEVSLQWYAPAFGTPLPEYIGFFASAGQWWTRYALTDIPVYTQDVGVNPSTIQDKPIPAVQFPKDDFAPWQVNLGWFWSKSHERTVQISFVQQLGFFTNKFPQVYNTVLRDTIPGGGLDTFPVASNHPSLWVMPYRLGVFLMPGYPYTFYYQGRDILSGTAMIWSRVAMDFPLKVHNFIDYPSPLSSLNKVQLSLIGDAGTVLNKTPDKIKDALDHGQHKLLMDYGVKASATFLMYHWIPMELYAQVFWPYNKLDSKKLYLSDYPYTHYHVDPVNGPYLTASDDSRNRSEYMKAVKDPRFFVGFTIGNL